MNALAKANLQPGLIAITRRQAAENPALVYVASLTTACGRRSMRQVLEKIAAIVSAGLATARTLDWASLRYQHTQAIRTALIESGYKPATVNKALSALRGTLKAAWQMGQMDAESYHRAASVANVKGSLAATCQRAKYGR